MIIDRSTGADLGAGTGRTAPEAVGTEPQAYRAAFPSSFLASVLAGLADPVFLLDDQFRVEWANVAAERLLGLDTADLVGQNALAFVHPDDIRFAIESLSIVTGIDGGSMIVPAPYRLRRGDGGFVTVEVFGGPIPGHDSEHLWVAAVARPTSSREVLDRAVDAMAAGASMREVSDLLMRAGAPTPGSACAMSWLDDDGTRCVSSAGVPDDLVPLAAVWGATQVWVAAQRSPGHAVSFTSDELPRSLCSAVANAGWSFGHIVAIDDPSNVEPAIVLRLSMFESDANSAFRLQRVLALARVALARRHSERRLEWAAEHDPLTRLLNRSAFFAELRCALDRDPDRIALLYLDLDKFKPINDQLGHRAGDVVLRSVAARLEEVVGDGRVARLGGDEFAILLGGLEPAEVAALAQRSVDAVAQPITDDVSLDGLRVTASVGMAMSSPGEVAHIDALVERADAAMYRAKAAGGGQWSD